MQDGRAFALANFTNLCRQRECFRKHIIFLDRLVSIQPILKFSPAFIRPSTSERRSNFVSTVMSPLKGPILGCRIPLLAWSSVCWLVSVKI
eukprot:9498408-Pyramimonas_sp.AAC.2